MNISLKVLGIIAMGISIFLSLAKIKLYDIHKNGVWVKMKIVKVPNVCYSGKTKNFFSFSYEDKIFIKSVKSGYCQENNLGDSVLVKYLPENPGSVLLPGETLIDQFVYLALLFLIGLLMIIYDLYANKKIKMFGNHI